MPTNTLKSGKRGGKTKTSWKPGQSGNPTGRAKDSESWAAIIKSVGDMFPADLVAFIGKDNDLGRMLSKLPQTVQMKYLVTARVFSALMFEPSSGLFNALMERAEGRVVTPLDMTSKGESINTDTQEIYDSILRKLGLATPADEAGEVIPTQSE